MNTVTRADSERFCPVCGNQMVPDDVVVLKAKGPSGAHREQVAVCNCPKCGKQVIARNKIPLREEERDGTDVPYVRPQ